MTTMSASASIEVGVDPLTAFTAFTEEIGQWWAPGPINAWDSARAVAKRIEPGVGGRFLEVYDDTTGDCLELGRVTVWEPGERFAYRSSVDSTEVDVRFEAIAVGTRVRVEHYVLPGADVDKAALFFPNVLHWLESWCARRDTARREPRQLARLSLALHYEEPAEAARWLHRVFGLTSWDRIPAEGSRPQWIELHVGNVAVLLFELEGKRATGEPVTHAIWVYVDDLDAHFQHAKENGATIVNGIQHHGYRAYTAEDLEGHQWTFVQAAPGMIQG